MSTSSFQQLVALSLVLSAPSALADGRKDGVLRQAEAPSREEPQVAEGAARDGQGRGFSLGLRAGYGVPFGRFRGTEGENAAKLSNSVSGVIPLQVDAGYFFSSRLYLGASFQYGVARPGRDCQEGLDCSSSQLRFGLNVAYHFQPSGALEPWAGLGIGYESLTTAAYLVLSPGGIVALKGSTRGFEFASFQGGLDYRVNATFAVGPFATFAAGQYWTSHLRIDVTEPNPSLADTDISEDIENKSIHAWLYGGLRMQARF